MMSLPRKRGAVISSIFTCIKKIDSLRSRADKSQNPLAVTIAETLNFHDVIRNDKIICASINPGDRFENLYKSFFIAHRMIL